MTRNPFRRLAAAALSLVAGAALLTGCQDAQSTQPLTVDGGARVCLDDPALADTAAVVYVAAAHANFPVGIPTQSACAAQQAYAQGVPVGLVAVEGSPRTLIAPQVSSPGERENLADEVVQADAKKATRRLLATASAAAPATEGADLVAALALGADQARTAAGNGKATLIVLDSGLSTTGAPGEQAEFVKDQGQCPNLTGITVLFLSLGYGIGDQKPLTPADRQAVTGLHVALVSTCGGHPLTLPAPVTGPAPVTTLTVNPTTPTEYGTPTLTDPIILRGDSPLGFLPQSTRFRRPEQAKAFLDELATELTTHPTVRVAITGRTANDPKQSKTQLKKLGKARAEEVKAQLVRRGIKHTRITTEGRGYLADPPGADPLAQSNNRVTEFTFN
jgi:outer membrane protein OmpA-like peptidoglycan-associated protein